jgi:DNA-binding transcriptional regulator/RsmH inhibitor MraZ
VFRTFMAGPELPRVLSELEAQWSAAQPMQVDYRPQMEKLERQRANLINMIKAGDLATELAPELKQVSSELEYLKMLSAATSRAVRSVPQASVEQRVEQMLKRLEEGGEAAQHAVRSIFPGGIWLRPDSSGRFLVAHARTSLPPNWLELRDADGCRRALGRGFTTTR